MRVILIISVLLVFPTFASAEKWICYDQSTNEITRKVQGDCLALGICSNFNNTGMKSNCFEVTDGEYTKSFEQFVKVKSDNVVGNRVINKTQAEIDAINLTQQNQQVSDQRQESRDILTRREMLALIKAIVQEFNRSRTVDGVSTITEQQIKDALNNTINNN